MHPVFKKPSLDSKALKDYSLVSNLPFFGEDGRDGDWAKVPENLKRRGLFGPDSINFRPRFSMDTEFAMLLVCGSTSILVLLNLLIALDTGKLGWEWEAPFYNYSPPFYIAGSISIDR